MAKVVNLVSKNWSEGLSKLPDGTDLANNGPQHSHARYISRFGSLLEEQGLHCSIINCPGAVHGSKASWISQYEFIKVAHCDADLSTPPEVLENRSQGTKQVTPETDMGLIEEALHEDVQAGSLHNVHGMETKAGQHQLQKHAHDTSTNADLEAVSQVFEDIVVDPRFRYVMSSFGTPPALSLGSVLLKLLSCVITA